MRREKCSLWANGWEPNIKTKGEVIMQVLGVILLFIFLIGDEIDQIRWRMKK